MSCVLGVPRHWAVGPAPARFAERLLPVLAEGASLVRTPGRASGGLGVLGSHRALHMGAGRAEGPASGPPREVGAARPVPGLDEAAAPLSVPTYGVQRIWGAQNNSRPSAELFKAKVLS